MKLALRSALAGAVLAALLPVASRAGDDRDDRRRRNHRESVQLGPRPFYLVEGMDPSPLKDRLLECQDGPFYRSDFSIAHRGAALQFPEHTDVSYRAGARQGAGIVECDVTFTKDGALVCRHSECDLHTTTNVVATALNAKCTSPWTGPGQSPAPLCCTSDFTLAELRTLTPKMDASVPSAATVASYLGGTAAWRTDLYLGQARIVTLAESIALNQELGVKHTPELKGAAFQDRVNAVFGGQEQYAQALVDELEAAHVSPRDAWPQSFNVADVLYWVKSTRYGKQAVYLDDWDPTVTPPSERLSYAELVALRKQGVRIFAPPLPALLAVTDSGRIVPSEYAKDIRRAGLDIITWTFERSDLRQGAAKGGFYYLFDPQGKAVKKASDMYLALDVLARDVKILGIFSDWPATVTYYANCMGL